MMQSLSAKKVEIFMYGCVISSMREGILIMSRYFNSGKMVAATAAMAFIGVASAGTISFQGEVTAQTCSANIDGGVNNTVLLDSIPVSDLGGPGSTSATITPFRVNVTGCTAPGAGNTQSYNVYFLSNYVDGTTGNLINTVATGGSNVQLQLIENNPTDDTAPGTQALDMDPGVLENAGSITISDAEESAFTTFGVRYYAPATPTVGIVESSMTYVVRYQ